MKKLGKVEMTARGFEIIKFKDRFDASCSLQASSLAEYPKPGTSAIWLGIDDANPQIMAVDARQAGIETTETVGWVPYPIPPQVMLTTRMHLDRDQVKALIRHLQNWLDDDTFNI